MGIVSALTSDRDQQPFVCNQDSPHADPHRLLFMLMPKRKDRYAFLDGMPNGTIVDAYPQIDKGKVLNDFFAEMRQHPLGSEILQPPAPPEKATVSLEDSLIDTIRRQVKEYGTLKEIMLGGHGSSETQAAGDSPTLAGSNPSNSLNTESFLDKIKKLQQELGVKVADRIVFAGCNVFTNLDPEKVAYYRNTAKELGAQIVGSTNTVIAINTNGMTPHQARKMMEERVSRNLKDHPDIAQNQEFVEQFRTILDKIEASPELRQAHALRGRYVQFTPEGEVRADSLDKSPDGIFEQMGSMVSAMFGEQSSWANCHKDKSQEEDAACQMNGMSGIAGGYRVMFGDPSPPSFPPSSDAIDKGLLKRIP